MYILKQLTDDEEYLPTVFIYTYRFKEPEVVVDMKLKKQPTDAQYDQLRLALKQWAKNCGFGVLAEAKGNEHHDIPNFR